MYCNGAKYASPLACAGDIFAREGARGFFKGWTANYARLGPQTTLMFVFMEKHAPHHRHEGALAPAVSLPQRTSGGAQLHPFLSL